MWCESYITFVHSFKLFQIWGGTRRLQSFRVNGSLVRKQSEWKRWDAESLDQKKCHYQDEKIVITRHKTDAESQETDWWWYFATKVYPEQVTTHTNKHHRLLGIISRILSDNNNICVSILDPLSHSACCFQCLCCTIPDQSHSHWTGCPCVCLPLWLGCVQSPRNFSDCTMHYYHRASH